MLWSIWNLHQSIPHLPSAAEYFLSPPELRKCNIYILRFQKVSGHEGARKGQRTKSFSWFKKIKIHISGLRWTKKYSAALERCGIWFLIDWWRFQIDLSTPTIPKAQKHYFLIKFTRKKSGKSWIFYFSNFELRFGGGLKLFSELLVATSVFFGVQISRI